MNMGLQEGDRVYVKFRDASGGVVWGYPAVFRNGWFDHENPQGNACHDTPESCNGFYQFFEILPKEIPKTGNQRNNL